MIERASVLSGGEKSLIDSVWSLIRVKSNQYTLKSLILPKLIICSAFLWPVNYSVFDKKNLQSKLAK